MKKMTFCFLSLMLFLMYACSVDDMLKPGQTDDQQSLSDDLNAKKVKGSVFTVYPTGADDTENLMQAFANAQAAGPGSVIRLVTGQYTIGFIEVLEFDGFLQGAGKGKTIISNLPDLPCEELWLDNLMPALLKFIGGNVAVSDMTIRIHDGDPCAYGPVNESVYGDLNSVLMFADYSYRYVPANRHIKACVENVDFIAGNDGGKGTYGTEGNVALTLFCGMDVAFPDGTEMLSSGEFSIKGCVFENGLTGPDLFGLDKNSVVTIENNSISGGSEQIFIGALYGTRVSIKNNIFREGWFADIFISDNQWNTWYYINEIPDKSAEYTISGNDFQSPPGVISLYMKDFYRTIIPDLEFPQLFDIKFNTFTTDEGGTAIMGLNNVGAKILNNTFRGTGAMGILLDGDEASNTFAENIKVLNNNFSAATYTDASVFLGSNTLDCMVVGVAGDNVVDLGVNNSIVGTKAQKKGPKSYQINVNNFQNIHEKRMKINRP